MLVYRWPQINLSGKYNPPLYHLSLLIPAYEHTRMPTSGDSQQPMKDKCLLFFFLPVLHENGRQENSPSMQAPISASPGPPHRSLSHTSTHRGLTNLNNTGGSVRFLSRLYLSVCLSLSLSLFFFSRYESQPLMQKRSSSVPVHFLDKCEQNVNSFQSTHIQAGGQKVNGWQQATRCNRSSYWTENEGVRPFSSG